MFHNTILKGTQTYLALQYSTYRKSRNFPSFGLLLSTSITTEWNIKCIVFPSPQNIIFVCKFVFFRDTCFYKSSNKRNSHNIVHGLFRFETREGLKTKIVLLNDYARSCWIVHKACACLATGQELDSRLGKLHSTLHHFGV